MVLVTMLFTAFIAYKHCQTMYLNTTTLQHALLPYIIYIPVPCKVSHHTHAYVLSNSHPPSLHICIHIKKPVIFCRHSKSKYLISLGRDTKIISAANFLSKRGEGELNPQLVSSPQNKNIILGIYYPVLMTAHLSQHMLLLFS